jgi:hypothetical protein
LSRTSFHFADYQGTSPRSPTPRRQAPRSSIRRRSPTSWGGSPASCPGRPALLCKASSFKGVGDELASPRGPLCHLCSPWASAALGSLGGVRPCRPSSIPSTRTRAFGRSRRRRGSGRHSTDCVDFATDSGLLRSATVPPMEQPQLTVEVAPTSSGWGTGEGRGRALWGKRALLGKEQAHHSTGRRRKNITSSQTD